MASFNHMDKSLNYFNGSDNLAQQENDQYYYGREAQQTYSSFGSNGLQLQQQQRYPQAPLAVNGQRNGSMGPMAGQEGLFNQMQQSHPMLPRVGTPGAGGPYGGMAVGPSAISQGAYSRSLIADDDSLGPPLSHRDESHLDASVFTGSSALGPSAVPQSHLREGDGFSGMMQQQMPRSSLSQLQSLGDMPSLPPVMSAAMQAGVEGTSKSEGVSHLEGKYGLMGLLDVIRMSDKDLNSLALGSDLTTFGLSLNSSESLYPSFSSPHMEATTAAEPQFFTPKCYIMHPPSLKAEHLAKFQAETLFYMFYAMPRDILQAAAAQELHRREWRFHVELKVWIKARAQQELVQGQPSVAFVYFDVNVWEARLFTTPLRGNLSASLLSEEEVRVKTPMGPLTLS